MEIQKFCPKPVVDSCQSNSDCKGKRSFCCQSIGCGKECVEPVDQDKRWVAKVALKVLVAKLRFKEFATKVRLQELVAKLWLKELVVKLRFKELAVKLRIWAVSYKAVTWRVCSQTYT